MTKRIHDKYISDQKPPTGNQNCQLCTWCAEASFRGIDILPRPIYSPRDPVFEYNGEDIVIHPIKKQFRNFREMNGWIMGQPNSRFYVHVKWNGGSGGHEVLLLTTNVPHVLDAQQGILSPITDMKTFNSYFGDIDFSETYLCRLDDRELNKALLYKLNSMDELVSWDESKDIPYMKEHDMMGDDEPIQEGAFQDIKNGVNPFSDKLVFHVTTKSHFDGQIFNPRVPEYLDPYDPNDKYFEDNTTPRISFSSSIEGCLNGIMVNMERDTPERFDKMYVYVPEKPLSEYKHKTTKQLANEKLVWDANVTREVWITEPVRMKLYGTIRVDQIKRVSRKQTTPNAKNEKNDRSYFTFKWHWIVPPKVLEKSTKFEYSTDKVAQWLSNDIKRFKYGLIRNGRLQTGNISDAEYDKYWVFHSGQEVDEAGGGNCYDYVEYEAGYLSAYGIPYQKYFMSFTTKKNQPIVTHTICVVPYEGKFIYIEGAYQRITSEWGHMRRKTFDKLNDIFDYIAECVADDESKDINFGVWDYTKTKIDYGTPIKEFMNLIFKHCDMIYDGEASKPKTVKEGGRMLYRKPSRFILEADDDTDDTDDIVEESATDMFIELGDMMFYVSEYHNALFDDPDAYDEVINEYGVLLDSCDGEFIEETAKPYDDYLRKHGYDPKTNTIEDPNNPGRRVNAGRIGSKKERNRMNKFLRENGYDPETETILTDINDRNNPGQKKRVKFGINSAIGNAGASMTVPAAYSRVDGADDYSDDTEPGIAMSKSIMQQKPGQSNYILKHEEGHMAYEDSFGRKRNGASWTTNPSHHSPKAYRDDINAARQHIRSQAKKNPALLGNSHDILPTEYQADKYAEEHNRYGRGHGAAALSNMMSKLKKFDPSTYQAQRDVMLSEYGTGENGFKKFAAALQDQYDMMLSMSEMVKGTPSASMYKKGLVGIKREIDAGFPESRKVFFSLTQPDEKKAIDEGMQRESDKLDAGTHSRIAFMKKYADRAQAQQAAADTKRRQLAKEQLKQQIASGKLTRDQAAKAARKIQRIEAFEAGKQQMQQQPKQQTNPQTRQDTISVGNQSVSEPTVKKEGAILEKRKPSRFFLEEDEEGITVGDIELDETEDDRDDETETETETSETEVDDRKPDSEGSDDDMDSETESVDEHLDVKNVDLGSFGSDTSDIQNDYDPKEIDILMKLMSSEADAMAEYMDAAKDTNVDVLRRLYADIANEERFHMEQLLFAKSEMTGEKYIPKDPDVKSEYEELLAMGMDEETAMQTAVDKCHIRGTIQSDEDDMDIELSEETETLESAMLQFGMTFDYMLEMAENARFSVSDYNHSLEIFTEACIGTDLVMEATNNGPIRGKKNPISILRNAIGFLVGMITKIVKKFADILRRLGNRTKQIRIYLKRYGLKGLFADNTLSMYFYDMNDPNRVSDSINYFLTLVYDVYDYAGRAIGLNMAPPPPGLVRSPRLQIRSLDDGIEKLNQVDLVKTKTVFPEDINAQTQIVQTLLGYNTEKLSGSPTVEGKSKNVMNYLIAVSEDWKRVMTQIQQSLGQMDALQMQTNSVYHTNKPLFNKAEKGMNACVKACKAFVNALTHDVGVLADLNKRLTDALANLKDKTDQLDARDAGATQPTEPQQSEQPAEQQQQPAEQPQQTPEQPNQQQPAQPQQQQAQQTPPQEPAQQQQPQQPAQQQQQPVQQQPKKQAQQPTQKPTTESALSKQLPPTAEVPQSQIDSLISSGQLKYYKPSRGFGGDSELTESNKPEWYAGFVNANGQLQVYLNQNFNKKLNTEYPWWTMEPEGAVFGTVAGKPYGLFANLNNQGGPITSQRPALCAKTAKGWGLVHNPEGGVIGGGSVTQS